jgi:hypothetical protein
MASLLQAHNSDDIRLFIISKAVDACPRFLSKKKPVPVDRAFIGASLEHSCHKRQGTESKMFPVGRKQNPPTDAG